MLLLYCVIYIYIYIYHCKSRSLIFSLMKIISILKKLTVLCIRFCWRSTRKITIIIRPIDAIIGHILSTDDVIGNMLSSCFITDTNGCSDVISGKISVIDIICVYKNGDAIAGNISASNSNVMKQGSTCGRVSDPGLVGIHCGRVTE